MDDIAPEPTFLVVNFYHTGTYLMNFTESNKKSRDFNYITRYIMY